VALTTFRQLVRDPALLIVAAAGMILIIAAPAYCVFQFDEPAKVMIDTGLSTVLLVGLVLALLGAMRVLAHELEDRTALTLLSKPVAPLALLAGKYAGLLAALLAVLLPLSFAVLYVTRISEGLEEAEAARHLGGVEPPLAFAALVWLGCAGAGAALAGAILFRRARSVAAYTALLGAAALGPLSAGPLSAWRWSVLAAASLITLEVAVIAAVALAAAVRAGVPGAVVAGLAVLILGHARALAGPELLDGGFWGGVGMLLPGLEALNALEAVAGGASVGGLYVASAAVYATMYAGAALLVGAAFLGLREVA
jgi:hypothetical protein